MNVDLTILGTKEGGNEAAEFVKTINYNASTIQEADRIADALHKKAKFEHPADSEIKISEGALMNIHH